MSDTEYPEVTEIEGIGSGIGDRMNKNGYYTIMEIAVEDPVRLSRVKGVGEFKAESLIEQAWYIVYEEYLTEEQYNVFESEYETVEKESITCFYCNSPFNSLSVWKDHQRKCEENPSNE